MSDNSLLGIVMAIVIGLGFAGGGLYMYQGQQEAIQEHEPVDATVVDTNVEREVTDDGDDADEISYYARITYEYTVDGQTYTSTNVRPAGIEKGYNDRDGAENFLADYQEGQQVTAYYDPQAPDEAFLVRETSKGVLAFAGIGGLVALLAGVSLVKKVAGVAL